MQRPGATLGMHRVQGAGPEPGPGQCPGHIGFLLASPDQVDDWYQFLKAGNVEIMASPGTHRDGARSLIAAIQKAPWSR
jgi:hypothetical protein